MSDLGRVLTRRTAGHDPLRDLWRDNNDDSAVIHCPTPLRPRSFYSDQGDRIGDIDSREHRGSTDGMRSIRSALHCVATHSPGEQRGDAAGTE